jgi:glutamine synthetase
VAAKPTAQVIHDCYDATGRLVPYAARSVLRRVCGYYRKSRLVPGSRSELEFYLVARSGDADLAAQVAEGP